MPRLRHKHEFKVLVHSDACHCFTWTYACTCGAGIYTYNERPRPEDTNYLLGFEEMGNPEGCARCAEIAAGLPIRNYAKLIKLDGSEHFIERPRPRVDGSAEEGPQQDP